MGEGATTVTIASLTDIATGIGSVSTWFWEVIDCGEKNNGDTE